LHVCCPAWKRVAEIMKTAGRFPWTSVAGFDEHNWPKSMKICILKKWHDEAEDANKLIMYRRLDDLVYEARTSFFGEEWIVFSATPVRGVTAAVLNCHEHIENGVSLHRTGNDSNFKWPWIQATIEFIPIKLLAAKAGQYIIGTQEYGRFYLKKRMSFGLHKWAFLKVVDAIRQSAT
jgi:hypothetical protein